MEMGFCFNCVKKIVSESNLFEYKDKNMNELLDCFLVPGLLVICF